MAGLLDILGALLLLDGLRANSATPGPPPPTPRRMQIAMRRNGERRLGATRKDR